MSIRMNLLTGQMIQVGGALVRNSSVSIKIICIVLLVAYVLSFFGEAVVGTVSLVPANLWPPAFHVWTLFTHCFLELHWWEVLVDLVTLVLISKLLEPLWGALEMVIFFATVNVGVAICCTVYFYLLYFIRRDTYFLFDVRIHGLAGYLAGVSVAVKQAMPDHVLLRTSLGGKFTNRNIPLTVFVLLTVLWLVNVVEATRCIMFGSGLVVGWVYLRFYQMHANGSKGDAADGFSFSSFFPNVIQPPIAVVSDYVFSLLVRLRVCRRPIRRYDIGGGSASNAGSISISLPGVESHDTERRRQIALKALSDRLSKAEPSPSVAVGGEESWPSLDDSGGGGGEGEEKVRLLSSLPPPPQQQQQEQEPLLEAAVHESIPEGVDHAKDLSEPLLHCDAVIVDVDGDGNVKG